MKRWGDELPEDVQAAVTDAIKGHFDGDRVKFVNVTPAFDSDGLPILRIYVVIEAKNDYDTLNASQMSSVKRLLRTRLEEFDIEAFPMVSYMTEADAKRRNLATI